MNAANAKQHAAAQQRLVNAWNAAHKPGAAVVVTKDSGEEVHTTTRSDAQLLSGHSAVIWLDGISGCYSLERVRPDTGVTLA